MDSLHILIMETDNDSIWVVNADILAGLKGLYSPLQAEKVYFDALEKLQRNSYNYLNKYEKIASIYDGLGILERRRNRYDKALEYYFKALKVKEQQKDTLDIGRSFHNIAMLHYRMKDYDLALEYMRKALPIRKRVDSISYALSLNNYGYFHLKKKVYDSAMFYFNKAKLLFGNDIRLNDANLYIARLYSDQKKHKEALKIHLQILEIYKNHGKQERVANTLKGIAIDYRKLNNFSEAEKYLVESESIAKGYGNKKLIAVLYKERYYIAKAKNDYKSALKHRLTYQKYQDSVFSVEELEKIGRMELNYQFEKQALVDSLNYEIQKEYQEIRIESQRTQKRLYGILLIITLLCLISLYFLYRYRHMNNIQKNLKQELEAKLLNEKIEFLRFKLEQLLIDNKMRVDFKKELKQKIKLINESSNNNKIVSEYQSLLVEIQNQIQTENRLDTVAQKVKNLDGSFEIKLAEQFPKLSKSEREVCKLVRLNLSMKEIMNILNLTMPSIKSIRYRIRKKMEVPKNIELEFFIQYLFK